MVPTWKPLAIASLALLLTVTGGAVAIALESSAARPVTVTPVPVQPVTAEVASEPAACLAAPELAPADVPADPGAGQVAVRFVIPPLTLVEVDGLGQPVAVSTNTGQAPCATDAFVAVAPDGTRAAASEALQAAVLEAQLTGSWQPGTAEPMPAR